VTRTGGSAGAVSVAYQASAGSAAAGIDFQPVASSVSWQAGETVAKTFTVPIIDDSAPESPETFIVRLASPTGGATLGATSTATVTITDNDAVTGACAPTGSAWTGNAGTYACSGNCDPCPSPQTVSVNGDIVTVSPFHAGGAATFQGCGNAITSQSNTLRYFGQSNHRATLTRSSNNSFTANIQSSGGGTCTMTCFR